MKTGIFYGVGVGPGDPELLTLKALRVLREVEDVFVPRTKRESESTALSIVEEHLHPDTSLHDLVFPMTKNKDILENAWQEGAGQIKRLLNQGRSAAFITLGDPMLYSTYVYLFKRIKKEGYRVETVPGIPSFCAAAASAGFPLAEGEEKVAVAPWSSGEAELTGEAIKSFESVVLMKVSGDYSGVRACLQNNGMFEDSILVSKCGHEDEEVKELAYGPEGGEAPYFSLVLARKGRKGGI